MIVSFLTLDLRPGAVPALVELFRRLRILERASEVEGCRSLYLTVDPAGDARVHVIGVWDDDASYHRWLAHPERETGSDELRALLAESWDPATPGRIWPVLHQRTGVTAPPDPGSP